MKTHRYLEESEARLRRARAKTRVRSNSAANRSVQTLQVRQRHLIKSEVLDAALRCFAEYGFLGTNRTDIALKSGIGLGSILHHFPTNLSLMKEAVDHLYAGRLRLHREAFLGINGSEDSVKRGVEAYMNHYKHPYCLAYLDLKVESRTNADLAEILRSAASVYREQLYKMTIELFPIWRTAPSNLRTVHELLDYAFEGMILDHAQNAGGQGKVLDRLVEWVRALRPHVV